jgi:two-component system LytT family sensor kinase
VLKLLGDVCAMLAPALSSSSVVWREVPHGAAHPAGTVLLRGPEALAQARRGLDPPDWLPAVVVLVPTNEAPHLMFLVAPLAGGRRLLSDDTSILEAAAQAVGRRIDAIRIAQERDERELREQQMDKLATEAELRALRAQINPHFLFNALTTIGYLIQTAPQSAFDTLMRLTSLLRAVLRSEGEVTTLGREIEIVEAYLEIERARFEARLRITIDVPDTLRHLRVPPLILQPLAENAVKHGIAPNVLGGEVIVQARLDADDAGMLVLSVRDTGTGATAEALRRGRAAGVGLTNVERRLAAQYGGAARLSMETSPGSGTCVEVRLPSYAAGERPVRAAGVHR